LFALPSAFKGAAFCYIHGGLLGKPLGAKRCLSEAEMVDTNWTIHGREFVNCNCSYGCPCQFNGLPTHGHCQAVAGMEVEQGHHGHTKLDSLKFVAIFRWPGAIHEGKGEAAVVVR